MRFAVGVSRLAPGAARSRSGSVDVAASAWMRPTTDVVAAGALSIAGGAQWNIANGTTLGINTGLNHLAGSRIEGTGTLHVSGFTSADARSSSGSSARPATRLMTPCPSSGTSGCADGTIGTTRW
jgi:hypothetical protein